MAEDTWSPRDPFSTTSGRGGNCVIVFAPAGRRFYRYCHLLEVAVEPGEFVQAGGVIGRVGSTGRDASLPGHGRHLHFEVNQYGAGRLWAVPSSLLAQWLREATANSAASNRTAYRGD